MSQFKSELIIPFYLKENFNFYSLCQGWRMYHCFWGGKGENKSSEGLEFVHLSNGELQQNDWL